MPCRSDFNPGLQLLVLRVSAQRKPVDSAQHCSIAPMTMLNYSVLISPAYLHVRLLAAEPWTLYGMNCMDIVQHMQARLHLRVCNTACLSGVSPRSPTP